MKEDKTYTTDKPKDKLSVVTYERNGELKPAGILNEVFNGYENGQPTYLNYYIPAITSSTYNNLYGRIMTLVEATTDKAKLRSVKTLFQRELNDYFSNLEKNVQEITQDHIDGHGYYYKNLYVYEDLKNGGRVISDGDTTLEI